ncbi:hypothetical protein GOODEAATRI_004976 [Goodea atripinnis]|uniref:HAT C-terminal dimerisation domain-containing protein n=1 Tax=Goodea atripinnis TaxID=208336 RepID=A0ABV0MPI0_9TELE
MKTSMEANAMLNKTKLKAELALICTTEWFRRCSGAVALYQVFMGNNFQDTFSETVALLKIPILTPMTTAESVRCFSSVKRIKTFLRKTMSQDCLWELEQTVEYHQYSEMDDSFSAVISFSSSQSHISLYLSGSLNHQPHPDPWSLESIFNISSRCHGDNNPLVISVNYHHGNRISSSVIRRRKLCSRHGWVQQIYSLPLSLQEDQFQINTSWSRRKNIHQVLENNLTN